MTLIQELECMAERHGICLFSLAYVQVTPDEDGEMQDVSAHVHVADCMRVKRRSMKRLRKAVRKVFLKRVNKIIEEVET